MIPSTAAEPRPIDRADAFARYVTLLERQLAALDDDDMAAFARLADQRDALAAAVGREPAPSPADAARLRPILEHALELDGRIRQRLHLLRERTSDQLRLLERQGAAAAGYLHAPPAGRRIDRRY